jgi:hypothetical protein
MRKFTLIAFIYALTVMMFGCQNRTATTRTVNITIQNSSTNDLDLVELQWQGPYIPGGSIPPGASKTSLDVPWPKLDGAKLSFTDDKSRQSNSIDLSFAEINKQVDSGLCRTVVIRIVSFQKVEIVKGD